MDYLSLLGPSSRIWIWAPILLAFVIAVFIAFVLIWSLHPLLGRYALARPNARSSHQNPTPQGGGIATTTSVIVAVACTAALDPQFSGAMHWLAIPLAPSVFLAALGGFDDLRPLPALPRLALQLLAVFSMIAVTPATLRIFPAIPMLLERAALILAVLWFVNLTNFMDGIDWMTVAEVVPISATLTVFGALGLLPPTAAVMAAALCGAMIGFAPFNRPVARLFLGDVGSLPVGLILGWLLLVLAERSVCAALLLPLYYISDATLTLLVRIVRGESVTQAHRRHFYQQAVDGGQRVYTVVGRVFATNIALAGLAFGALHAPMEWQLVLFSGGAALVGVLLVALGAPSRAKAN